MSMRSLRELIEPQFGKNTPKSQSQATPSKSSSDLDGDGKVDSYEKKVRQLIYDVRHLERSKHLPLKSAFAQRVAKTNYPPEVVKAARDKLDIGSSVAEASIYESDGQSMIPVVIKYNNGTTDRRRVTRGEIQRLRSQPNVSSVEMTKYGVASKDYDGDGRIESGKDEHAGSVHNAIQRKIGGVPDGNPPKKRETKKKMRSYGVSEGFSNWREELFEIADDGLDPDSKDMVKEKPVNNYAGGKNSVVKISPTMGMKESVEELGGEILEIEDISENYLIEEMYSNEIAIATEYFCEQGLNEYGIDILIEKLGVDEFCDYVEDIAENYCLLEWRRGPGGTKIRGSQMSKSGKHISSLKGGAKASAIRGSEEHKSRKSEREKTDDSGSQMNAALKSQSEKTRRVATKTAAVKQPVSDKKPEETKKGIAGRIGDAFKRAVVDTRVTAAVAKNLAQRAAGSEAGQRAGKALGDLRAAGRKAEQSPQAVEARRRIGQSLKNTANRAIDVAQQARQIKKEEYELQEKSLSISQQQAAGAALSAKRGDISPSELKGASFQMYKSMTKTQLRDFAKTKHKGLPDVKEAVEELKKDAEMPNTKTTQQKLSKQIALTTIQKKMAALNAAKQGAMKGVETSIDV